MWLELITANSRYMVGNVYVPHSGMEAVYESLERDINCYHAEGAQFVCCGDFNAHIGQLEDRQLALMVKLSFPSSSGLGMLMLQTSLELDSQTCAYPQVRSFVLGEAADAHQ